MSSFNEVNSIDEIITLMQDDTISVISFDVFDTLITRPIGRPTDLFELMDKYYKEVSDSVISFKKLRIEAESVIRRKIISKETTLEDIPLSDIYDVLRDEFGMDTETAEKLMQYEVDLELQISIRREAGNKLYQAALATGKKIIIISDMYLTGEHIGNMLEKSGYSGWDKIYVSSDIGLRKKSGNLYRYVLQDLNTEPEKILHIGDNKKDDVESARELGIRGVWIPRARFMYDSFGCNEQVKKICADLTNWEAAENSVGIGIMKQLAAVKYFDDPFRAFEEKSDYNGDPYFVGYAALGMELFALVKWIMDSAKRDNVSKLIFMARDGYLPMKAYEIIKEYREKSGGTKLPKAEYLPVSRLAVFPAMIKTSMDLYDLPIDLNYQTPAKLLEQLDFCIRDCCDEELAELMQENGFVDMQSNFTKDTYIQFINLIIRHLYDENKHKAVKKHIARYFLENEHASITDNAALFDMGYSGRIPAAIMQLTDKHPKVYYFHADSREHYRYQKSAGMEIKSFFDFNPYMESSLREYAYLEPAASCIGYDENLQPLYDIGPAEGYSENAVKLQQGALDFIKDYLEYFGEFENEACFRYHDAAMPFEAFIRYCSEYDRVIYDKVLIDDELWGGRRDIDLKELMEIRLGKIPEYAKERK